MNLAREKKSTIIEMARWKCPHGHSGIEHPRCWFKYGRIKTKVGFLDIECNNLKADFGIILSWCIKEQGGKILSGLITKKDLESTDLDKRLVRSLVERMRTFDTIVTYYGCVTSGHKILTADLKWVNVETLKMGDAVLGFDENGKQNCRRHFKLAHVTSNIPMMKEAVEISFADGTTIQCSTDHPWLVKRSGGWIFRKPDELQHPNCSPSTMERIMPVWETDDSYLSGYIAAFLDGEGCVSQAKRKGRSDFTFTVSFTQKDKQIINKFCNCLDKLGYKHSIRQYDKSHSEMRAITILGNRQDKLKFLGETRPQKIDRVDWEKLGGVTKYGKSIPIKSIENIGKKKVWGLSTTSATYIVEGFGCHNTGFDLPFIRSRCLYHGIDFPMFGDIKHLDVYYMVKSKLCISRKSLENACRLIGVKGKTHLDGKYWIKALTGDKKALGYILNHNEKDVEILEKLYNRLIDYVKGTKKSI